jgi:hypothetical protein
MQNPNGARTAVANRLMTPTANVGWAFAEVNVSVKRRQKSAPRSQEHSLAAVSVEQVVTWRLERAGRRW